MASPTILVPGITGTTLMQTYDASFDTIWSAIQKRYETIESLALDPQGQYDEGTTDLIVPGEVEGLAYGECVGYLRKRLKKPVYIFRYDWRLSCLDNARALSDFVVLIKKKCSTRRVSFVTHSMGGLILLGWLGLSDRNVNAVDRAVLTVPPLRGAALAASSLIIGESGPLYFNSSTKFRKVSRTCPSVHELVGFYVGAFRRETTPLTPAEIWDETNWQRRVAFRDDAQRAATQKKRDLLRARLEGARDFHENRVRDLDALSDAERARFAILYGVGVPTPDEVPIRPQNTGGEVVNLFDFSSFDDPKGDGDGTVPKQSLGRFIRVDSYELPVDMHSTFWNPLTFDDAAKITLAGYHGAFLALDKIQSIAGSFLSGQPIDRTYLTGIRP